MAQHSLDNINNLLPFQNLNDNEFEMLNDPTIESYRLAFFSLNV